MFLLYYSAALAASEVSKTLLLRFNLTQAENTFLLALDGDVDFKPDAVRLLVDRMRKNCKTGAACGRIHPIGAGGSSRDSVRMLTCVCLGMSVRAYMYVCTCLCVHVCACMFVCMCLHVCVYMSVCAYMFVHTCLHACLYVCLHYCIHVCTFMSMHACLYVCLCIHVCAYMCVYDATDMRL